MAEQGLQNQLRLLGLGTHVQNTNSLVSNFEGNPKKFKTWLKEIEKYSILMGAADEQKRYIAFQSSSGPVSDCILRFLGQDPQPDWPTLREQLRQRFGEAQDMAQALAKLRRMRQGKSETVQVFSERIVDMANDAFPGENLDNPLIARQLVEVFIDGLLQPSVARRLIKDPPGQFREAVRRAAAEQDDLVRIHTRGRDEAPMDINAVSRNPVTKGACHSCGGQGHWRRDCPSKGKGGGNKKAPQKGKGSKNDRPQGKSKQTLCWGCDQPGHVKRDCPLNKKGGVRGAQGNGGRTGRPPPGGSQGAWGGKARPRAATVAADSSVEDEGEELSPSDTTESGNE